MATLPRTAPTKFLHQEHHTTTADPVQGIITTTTGGIDNTPSMVPDIGDDTTDCSHTPIHAMTEVTVLEGTLHTLLPATATTQATLQLMDALITLHAIATPHPHTCHFSHRHHSCHPLDQSQSHSSNSHNTTQGYQYRKVKQFPRPSTPNKPNCPQTVTIQGSHSGSSSDSDNASDPLNY